MVVDGAYRTDDLIKATILSMEGLHFSLEQVGSSSKAVFVFVVETDEDRSDMDNVLAELVAGRHEVEPFAFARELRVVRTRLYRFLEHHRGTTPAIDKRRLHQG